METIKNLFKCESISSIFVYMIFLSKKLLLRTVSPNLAVLPLTFMAVKSK